ncbi:unnamed protein product [Pseudo-nitzschia multistriata]|uniref:ubiquitinyl hydrolase 1 n=1 Tax=Pseudo-nitzschia multistriata TaxID=183589 RepID=A0A448Z071_9STRA|nr:unnamed protein product [Pseudo-nitzschia multistriata]
MEINNISSLDYDALCARSALAFLVKIQLKNLDDALKVIGKEQTDLSYLNEQQDKDVLARTSSLSQRAYIQQREMHAKDSILNREEEKEIFGSTVSNGATFLVLPLGFNHRKSISCLVQNLAFELHTECFNQTNSCCLFSLLCSTSSLQGITEATALIIGPKQSFASLFHPQHRTELSFHNIWLNLYNICITSKIKDEPDKKLSLSFLLTWVLTEFPDAVVFLQQLSIIATFPETFPPALPYTEFVKPGEMDYQAGTIHKVIDSHLRKFHEIEPSCSCENTRWRKRRDDHNKKRQKDMNALESLIRSQWCNGEWCKDFSRFSLSLRNVDSFTKEVHALFDRWKKADELHKFITEVTRCIKGISPDKCQSFVELDRDNDSFWKKDHVLPTSLSPENMVVESCPQDLLMDLDPYTFLVGSLHHKSESYSQSDQLSRLLSLDCSKFVRDHQDYKQVWDALVKPLEESWSLACNDRKEMIETFDSKMKGVEKELQCYLERAEKVYSKCLRYVTRLNQHGTDGNNIIQLQNYVGLWNSSGPYDLIQHCLEESTNESTKKSLIKKSLIVFAMSIKHVQRARRCLRLLLGKIAGRRKHLLSDLSIRFMRSNPGLNESWDAYDHPEFLIFEIDNDVGIRDTQARVAFEILEGKRSDTLNTSNRLIQLNMGEGKTAVIMPIVLARAARGDKLVRASVLSSLYATNASDWQYKLGGLLNRRIYPMFCRRDIPIGKYEANLMLQRCEKIREGRHVIVTVPEHRLSLENKSLELASEFTIASDLNASQSLHNLNAYLWKNARDFLDESDEILSPKYQLIYTLGSPCDLDGAQLRWEIHSCIYESLNRHASSLLEKFGSDTIELGRNPSTGRRSEYCGFRLLEGSQRCDEVYNEIKKIVVNDILSGESNLKIRLMREEKIKWKRCVDGEGNGNDLDGLPASAKVLALCLRGMLQHDVLKSILFKRWRVQYGNHPTRKRFDMAVPYRAKDVAAERTEFGHPDVGLSLTFAHYFQAGLQEQQLRHVFEKLQRMNNSDAKAEYSSWVESEEMEGISSYDGVNIEDTVMFKTKLFPCFRKNMRVIRFWLFKLILPVQAKQFPLKLLSTAPELCRSPQLGEHWTAVTTGFSGTDDLSLLLPPTIVQENIESLKMTNGVQLISLLREENNDYCSLTNDDTTDEIIKRVFMERSKQSIVNVVLDAGALVLHKSNRDFARAWLQIRTDMDAVAFFEGSTVFVLTQDGIMTKFDSSPFCSDMSRCLLYLDDIHTRGSDFLLPLNTRAVLTLGKGMQKDKFIQACMRMRQLGHGQSITFVASREVNRVLETDFDLLKRRNGKLGYVSVILEWTIANSVKRICHLMPYFASQMRSTLLKADAYNTFKKENDSCLKSLTKACVEAEILELSQLYGHERGDDFLPYIIDRHLSDCSFIESSKRNENHVKGLVEVREKVKETIRTLAPSVVLPCSMLDEEQERELEQELEEEIDIERPPPAVPLVPKFSKGLLDVLTLGKSRPTHFSDLCSKHLEPLSAIFGETSYGESPIGRQLKETDNVFVTTDFIDTVKGKTGKEFYVKNIRWFLRWGSPKRESFVVISNYEAENLSNLLSPMTRKWFAKQNQFPSLYAFTPITRHNQPREIHDVSSVSCEPPVAVHVFGGSVHACGKLLEKIRNFLSVFPRPKTDNGRETWDSLFEGGFIDRDGFVLPGHRGHVDGNSSIKDFDGSTASFFYQSPVKVLRTFYGDCRHLGSELPTSSVGRLLGASQLTLDADDDE